MRYKNMINDETLEVIDTAVNCTIAKLKLSGLMKDNRQTAFQKTEEILKSYNELKRSDRKSVV